MYEGERFNSISHLVGSLFALAGLSLLVVLAAMQGDPWKIVSFSIYGTSLFLVYLNSTCYHTLKGRKKAVFKKLDHLSIYLLIAGTYTPLTLVTLNGGWGWSLFGVIWGLAVLGICLEFFLTRNKKQITVTIYGIMGWLVLVAIGPLYQLLPRPGLISLVIGGVFYTAGIYFYIASDRIRHSHGIWHLFVIAGSSFHFLTMLFIL
jgi:hemolysin III